MISTYKHTTGLNDAIIELFAFSRSFPESDFKMKVVCRVFWLVEASTFTPLNLAVVCFMISPNVVGFPSLPAFDKLIAESVNVSVTIFDFITELGMRGPAAPQPVGTDFDGWMDGANDGKACSESVSSGPLPTEDEGVIRDDVAGSSRDGNGSGVPSKA